MASSKLFSGDLPELTYHIIQYLGNDLRSLHSCVLVNRFWCRLTIPKLWEDPFSTSWRVNFNCHFLDIYFLFLSFEDKMREKEFGKYKIDHRMNSLSFNPLFNYPNFIKTLNTYQLKLHVINWLAFLEHTSYIIQNDNNPYLSLIMTQDKSIANLDLDIKEKSLKSRGMISILCVLLFKLFITKGATLNDLNMTICRNVEYYFIEVYTLILKNPNFVSDVENFTLTLPNTDFPINSSRDEILRSFLSLFTSIKKLTLPLNFVDNILLSNNLTNLIQSQANLSSLTITTSCIFMPDAFRHCSKNLTILKFHSCYFTDNLSFRGLKYLTQLKSLHVIECLRLNHVIQPLLDIPTPLKINSLTISCKITTIVLLQLLFQKIGSYLEHLELSIYNNIMRGKALESIIENCDKIKFLNLNNLNVIDNPRLFKLITNSSDHLKYLSLKYNNYNLGVNVDSLEGLGQILTGSLEYLNLCLPFNPGNLRSFLNSYRGGGIKKLIIRNKNYNTTHGTLNDLKDFVKTKDLNYLSYRIENEYYDDNVIHVLEELVKEILIYVKMKNYEDLIVKISDFDA
ncbi:2177_t:CDS:1 [Funneliformis geosporum]|nr:2177_t:CDS:1 [Funneliformis geosporum]